MAIDIVSWTIPEGGDGLSRITWLRLVQIEGQDILYASTRYGGVLSAWGADQEVTELERIDHTMPATAGLPANLGLIALPDGGQGLLTGGGVSGALTVKPLAPWVGFGPAQSLGILPNLPADLHSTVTVTLPDGTQALYGGLLGVGGIGWLTLDAAGGLLDHGVVADTDQTYADQTTALATVTLAGQRMVISAGGGDLGLTTWAVDDNGGLSPLSSIGADAGIWIDAPTALHVGQAGGQSYAILAAAGSDSLTVVALSDDGSMRVTDHVIDSRDTRFGGVTALEVVTHQGHSWVVAGGADDGISVLRLIPGGRLLHVAAQEDTLDSALGNINAVAVRSVGERLDIYATGDLEAGITRLRFEASAGEIVEGTAASERLWGSDAGDVLLDGAGTDTVFGGAGADTFVLSHDGARDVIGDFTPSEDRLDLSGWPMLRHLSQLDMAATDTGLRIRYGSEELEVITDTGTPLDPASLGQADLIGQLRLTPALFVSADVAPTGTDIIGTPGQDRLQATATGNQLIGLAGNDSLMGGIGSDWLFGGEGRDRLDGGAGRNRLEGGLGNDTYVVRGFGDEPRGEIGFSQGGGIDTIEAHLSYTLPRNYEVLRLQGSGNINGFGNGAPEVLVGNPGDNLLSGGWGQDRIVGKAGDDRIVGGALADELVGDAGRDTFVYTAVSDSRAGRETRDFINGFERGRDRIDLSLIDTDPETAQDDAFVFIGRSRSFSGQPGELSYASYGGNWNIVSGDIDGDRQADFQIFINLTHWMTGSDFIL